MKIMARKNKQKEKEYQKLYRENNKEKINASKKAHYERNREKISKKKTEYNRRIKKENPQMYKNIVRYRKEYMTDRRNKFSGDSNIKGKLWTEEEDNILMSNIKETEMVQLTGRSLISIQQRKWKLRHSIRPKMVEMREALLLKRIEKEEEEYLTF